MESPEYPPAVSTRLLQASPVMRIVHFIAVASVAVASLAMGPIQALAQFDGPEAETVRQREVAFAQTMADRDFEAFLTFLSPDAIFFAGNRPLRGIDQIGDAWRRFFDGDEAPFSWQPDQVQVINGGGLAFSSGPVLGASGEPTGRFNSIWRKDPDGVWRIVFDKGS